MYYNEYKFDVIMSYLIVIIKIVISANRHFTKDKFRKVFWIAVPLKIL